MDEAYDGAKQTLPAVLQLVLDAITEVQQTCDELEVSLKRTHQSVSPALHRLRELGLIEPSGIKRMTRSNKPAIVWRKREAHPKPLETDTLFPMPALRWRSL